MMGSAPHHWRCFGRMETQWMESAPHHRDASRDGNIMDGERSPSPRPYYFQKLLCKWGALPNFFAHVNQKLCFTNKECSLCGMSFN
jgi:hypothetical protein